MKQKLKILLVQLGMILLIMLIQSCRSFPREEPTKIVIQYKIPEVYFPAVPLIVYKWDADKQMIYLTEEEVKLLMLYFEGTEEAIETLYGEQHPP